jgi:CheY-like chemotaxis protein
MQAAGHPQLRPGVYARLSVCDTGCGMDQATQRRIFEPFFTTKASTGGTGLGLSVVLGIVEAHGGAIIVYSQPGEGTTFRLYFPEHAGEEAAIVPDGAPVPVGQGERILFVDDEVLLAQLGQKALAALGYEVEATTEAATALAMVRKDPGRFALVFTDMTMPGMTGLSLAEKLHEVRMTGNGLTLAPEKAEAAGIREVLLKPTSIHSMGFAVHSALSPQAALQS